MKEPDMTRAIEYLPEEFITQEMVNKAATEHKAELINFLPERYITPQLLDVLFDARYTGWDKWELSRIPEEKRTYPICLKAVDNDKGNFKYVPDNYKDKPMVKCLLKYGVLLDMLPFIPHRLWDTELAVNAIETLYGKSVSQNCYRYGSYTDKSGFLCSTQILLTFIPKEVKGTGLYIHLVRSGRVPVDFINRLVPECCKQQRYYREVAVREIAGIDAKWLDYKTAWRAVESNKENLRSLLEGQWIDGIMDDRFADKAMEVCPELFNRLPARFRTPERLVMILDGKGSFSRYSVDIDEGLMTEEVCKALARRDGFYPPIPEGRWTREFVDYYMEHGKSMDWFPQMPKKFQTWEMAERILERHTGYSRHLKPYFITPETAKRLYRKDKTRGTFLKRHIEGFCKYTGLPEEFFGGEVPFSKMEGRSPESIYCRMGLTYLALQKSEGWNPEYHLIMTRHASRYSPAEQVFKKQITTFHKTWLLKTVCDNDPEFKKPIVDKRLKDVQAFCYYGVETVRTVLGCHIYRNTFMGQTVGYCIKKDGTTYHAQKLESLIPGLKYKRKRMAEAVEIQPEDSESRVIDASALHRDMGYCMTGIEAFAEDYGLDADGSYTIRQIKETIAAQGYKPSLDNYKQELRKLQVI